MDFATVTASVASAISLGEKISELAGKSSVSKTEMKETVAEMRLQLATIKGTLADLIEENRELKRQLKTRDELPNVLLKNGMYWKAEDDGPYCTNCYDSEEKLIRVSTVGPPLDLFGKWRCPQCTAKFQ